MPVTRIKSLTRKRARELRRNMTMPEWRLWRHLRNLKPLGFHFRRQAPIGPYIADFAEFGRRLVIELDGPLHGSNRTKIRDAQRDAYLRQSGFLVLRIPNGELVTNSIGVIEFILDQMKHDD
ncbi:MAG TPA: endonuclease domain-containing protein [Aestuariivirgaceae bacterium]